MKKTRILLALGLALLLAFSLASAEDAGKGSKTVDGFTIEKLNDSDCRILDTDEANIKDGTLIIPDVLDGMNVNSFYPAVVKEGVRTVIYPVTAWLDANEDNAPDQTLRFNALVYAGFKSLSADQLDRLPDMKKGEYALTEYYEMVVSRNGNVENNYNNLSFLTEADIPAELLGQKVYNLIDPSMIALTEGDWTCVSWNDGVMLVGYQGEAGEKFVVPEKAGENNVAGISVSAIPAEAAYVYIPDQARIDTQKRYSPAEMTDRAFVRVEYISYEYAKENDSYMLERVPALAEGAYAVRSIEDYSFDAAADKEDSSTHDGFIPAEEILTEINGAPLLTDYVGSVLAMNLDGYTYSMDNNESATYISGPVEEDGITLVIPSKIGDLSVTGYYMDQIPEGVTQLLIPNHCYNRKSTSSDREFIGYSYEDYDMIHSDENIWDYELAVQPGEYLVASAVRITGSGSESIQQDMYLYPTSINGHKVHLHLNASDIKTYTSDSYTYYKIAENEAVISAFSDKEARKIEVPETLDGLTVVGINGTDYNRVFDCDNAEEIILPATLRILGDRAISSNSKKLKTIALPAGLKELGSSAIWNWYLQTIVLPDGLESIGSQAIYGYRIKKLDVPDSVTRIDAGAFTYLSGLQSLKLPAGMTEIPKEMCNGLSRLTAIEIPEGVTVVRESAFNGCARLGKLTFKGTNLKTIEDSAFVDCASLKKLDLPEGLETIGYQAFYGCKGLGTLVIPSTVKSIGKVAFGGCSKLAKVEIGENVTEIADDAFADCSKKLTIITPEGSYAWTWAEAKGYIVKAPK